MNLSVGLLGTHVSRWKALLDQIGISYGEATLQPGEPEFPVVVVSESAGEKELDRLRTFLRGGGGVLCSAEVFGQLRNCTGRREIVRWVEGDSDNIFAGIGPTDLYSQCTIPDEAGALRTTRQRWCSVVDSYGGGRIVVLPFDSGQMMRDDRSMRKSFYAARTKLPHERVATVSRSGVRELVTRGIEYLFHQQDLPFVHKWYYPNGEKTLFAFRVDTDYASAVEIDRLSSLLRQHEIGATWFFDVKSHASLLPRFSRLEGHEVGLHCFDHITYDDVERNSNNIRRGLEVLEKAAIRVDGFAAPYGSWNPGIAEAIRLAGFSYSSEFAYDHDNFPSVPILGDDSAGVLQLPIHPISIGSLRRQGFDEQSMKEYFKGVVENHMQRRLPLFIYHHPKDGCEPVLGSLFDVVKAMKVPTTTMRSFAAWWKKRAELSNHASVEREMLSVSGDLESDVWLRLTSPDGREAIVAPQGKVDLNQIQWMEIANLAPLPKEYKRVYAFNPWIQINRMEDAVQRMLNFSKR